MNRVQTGNLGERVASLETDAVQCSTQRAEHETRLDSHDAWLNQVRGSLRTLVVLWTIAMALLGLRFVQDYVSKPARADSATIAP